MVLVHPPQWTPQNPPFALAALGGHLRSRGLRTRLVDLNLEFYREVLRPEFMAYSRNLAELRRGHLAGRCQFHLLLDGQGMAPPSLQMDAAHLLRLEAALNTRPDPWTKTGQGLPQALKTLRGQGFYDPQSLVQALALVDSALELAALPYDPTTLALNDCRTPRYPLSLEGMERGTRDQWGNMFLPFFRARLSDVLQDGPRVVAISISSFSQVLAGLTLARLVREAEPDCHLTLGGNFFGRVANRLQRYPEFFRLFCDSLAIGEGEVALERLVKSVREGQSPPRIVATGPQDRVPLQDMGYLDLADLPLGEYLTPEPVLCIQASRGCYWANCSFCDSYWGVPLDFKTPQRVASEMAQLRQRYGIRHFEFIDECLPPPAMLELAQAIQGLQGDLRWFANARLEPDFAGVLPALPRAGATMLLWGFESGSPEVLKRLRKGVHSDQRWELLGRAAEAGLWNFAYVFFGFPGETREDALATIQAISQNTHLIHSYGRSVFSLGRHSPMAQEPERYGLFDLTEEGTELSVNLTFRSHQGPSPQETMESAELCNRMCREAYGDPLWMVLRNRENLHLYLDRYGPAAVREWGLTAGLSAGAPHFQK